MVRLVQHLRNVAKRFAGQLVDRSIGCIDGMRCGVIRGWYIARHPDSAQRFKVTVDDLPAGEFEASIHRADLFRLEGIGRCGFVVDLTPWLSQRDAAYGVQAPTRHRIEIHSLKGKLVARFDANGRDESLPKRSDEALPLIPEIDAAALPEVMEFTGEFGNEISCFLPTVYGLHTRGLLSGRRVKTYAGMRPYYYFLDQEQFEVKVDRRSYVPIAGRPAYLENRNEHDAVRSDLERFPDYRAEFGALIPDFDKPVLVVNNKYCNEWNMGAVNFIACEQLDRIFRTFKARYQIVYIREGIGKQHQGFSSDHNVSLQFEDIGILRAHPEVLLFDEMLERAGPDMEYNQLKLALFAQCYFFITSQGGGAALCAMFGDSLIVVMHREGKELRQAYSEGFYTYASRPAPRILIARDSQRLESAIDLLGALGPWARASDLPDWSPPYSALLPLAHHDRQYKLRTPRTI